VKRSSSLHSIKSTINKSSSSLYSLPDNKKTLVQAQNEEVVEKGEGRLILDSISGGQDVAIDIQKDSFLKTVLEISFLTKMGYQYKILYKK
jgi:hypothetical protein